MAQRKLIVHSNAPWVPTGYGNQTELFAPHLAEQYDLAISAFYGLEGAPIRWSEQRIPILPGVGGEYGSGSLVQHAERFFGEARNGLVLTLMDVWVLDPEAVRNLNLACWCPVDHEPAPPGVIKFLELAEAIPIAMSRFGQEKLAVLDPLYVPHGVNCEIFAPRDKEKSREGRFPDGAFVVGMVAANKGHPSRKGFSQAFQAVARLMAAHDDVYLYLHTVFDPLFSQGENLVAMLRQLGIPQDRIRIADQYTMIYNPLPTEAMAQVYNALDVLLNPAWGEGFGIPILEAQACGVPAIVTDFSAMAEVCGSGWKVKWRPYWSALEAWQAIPDVDDIVAALEECRSLKPSPRKKLSQAARRHAMSYDFERVLVQYLLPALNEAERRFSMRRPIRIPSRRLAVAA